MKVFRGIFHSLQGSGLGARKNPLARTSQIIVWWELRRIVFNLCVGAAGALCLLGVGGVAFVSERLVGEPFGLPDPPGLVLLMAAVYGVAANAFYTMGWLAELVVRSTSARDTSAFGTAAFSLGLIGSIVLTLFLGAAVAVASLVSLGFSLTGRGLG